MRDGYTWWCKDCAAAKDRTHYAANLDKERERGRTKAVRRKPQIKVYNAQWYLDNKETKDAQSKQWWGDNPWAHAHYTQMYRGRIHEAPLNDLTEEQWQEILRAFDYRCAFCPTDCQACRKKTHKLEREHLTPVSKGGSYTVANIVPSCLTCNRRKHNGPVPKPVQPLLLTIAPSQPMKGKKN
jgi:hypothetical protein